LVIWINISIILSELIFRRTFESINHIKILLSLLHTAQRDNLIHKTNGVSYWPKLCQQSCGPLTEMQALAFTETILNLASVWHAPHQFAQFNISHSRTMTGLIDRKFK
jgi:hypothetical protein